MKTIFLGIMCISLYAHGQIIQSKSNTDINWENNLSWVQIIEKAKKENKYIFVDCYTTWCAPCKRMDNEVYVNDSVANYFNARFLNVRVQMDKTKQDDKSVQLWYKDAARIQRQYNITAFPSYLFFDPEGKVVHRGVSFQEPADFLKMAAKAFDSKTQFYTRKSQYENGQKDYAFMMDLYRDANKFGDRKLVNQIMLDYLQYLEKKPSSVVYSRDNIEFIASAIPGTKNKWIKLFYPKGTRVNKIMNMSGLLKEPPIAL